KVRGSARRLGASTCFRISVRLAGMTQFLSIRSGSFLVAGGLPRAMEKLAAALARPRTALFVPPLGDLLVVPLDQHVGDLHPAELPRARVLWIFQKPLFGERFVFAAGLVPQDAGHQANEGVYQQHGRHFAPVGDEVANRDFERLESNADPLVETFIAP